jgi:hypothetical protein
VSASGEAEHDALVAPIECETRVAQQRGGGKFGRVPAVQNGGGDVGREEGEAEQPGDLGTGHAPALCDLLDARDAVGHKHRPQRLCLEHELD